MIPRNIATGSRRKNEVMSGRSVAGRFLRIETVGPDGEDFTVQCPRESSVVDRILREAMAAGHQIKRVDGHPGWDPKAYLEAKRFLEELHCVIFRLSPTDMQVWTPWTAPNVHHIGIAQFIEEAGIVREMRCKKEVQHA